MKMIQSGRLILDGSTFILEDSCDTKFYVELLLHGEKTMRTKKANETKERILKAAWREFMERGYEEASVRTIIEKSGTVTGSFYHYFASKEALFETVIERFLSEYTEKISVIAGDITKDPQEQLEAVLMEIELCTSAYYKRLKAGTLHWTIQYSLHVKTMQAILPSIKTMLERGLSGGKLRSKLDVDTDTLANVLLNGIEGILHAKPMDSLSEEDMRSLQESVRAYTALLLEYENGKPA